MNYKSKIIDILTVYKMYYSFKKDGRYFGYARAIDSLNEYLSNDDNIDDIKSLLNEGIYGVGDSIKSKILMVLDNELPPHYLEFSKEIPIDKKSDNPHKHYQTRESATNLIHPIIEIFDEYKLEYYLCGSYRRESFIVGDLDILVVAQDLNVVKSLLDIINDSNMLSIDYQAVGDYKIKIEVKNDDNIIEIDFRSIPKDQLGSMLLHFTGPRDFNIKMRRISLTQGYSLSEYGLTNSVTNELIKFDNELDIFKFLGINFIEPKNRK